MCTGRPAHHIEEEKRRAAAEMGAMRQTAESQRLAELARMTKMQLEADARQREVLRMIADTAKQAFKTKADAITPLLRTKRKASTANVASLRINRTPGTNVGVGSSGTNIT